MNKVVATELGVEYVQLRYKPLEIIKEKHLKLNNDNFDSTMIMSRSCKSHNQWRIDNIEIVSNLFLMANLIGKSTLTAPRQVVGRMIKPKTVV